jgi:hypothetical protein
MSAAPGIRYRYESLNPHWVPGLEGRPGHFRYQRPGTPGPQWLQDAADRAFSGHQSWKQRLRAVVRGYGASLLRSRGTLVLKDPTACLLAGWLAERTPCRVVVLTRHPCGFAASVTALGWPLRLERLLSQESLLQDHLLPVRDVLADSANDPLTALGAFWAAVHLVLRNQGRGRWHFQSFERLCLSPEEGFQEFSEALGFTLKPATAPFRHRSDPGSTAKDGRQVALAWQKHLTRGEIERILLPVRACGLASFVESPEQSGPPAEPTADSQPVS